MIAKIKLKVLMIKTEVERSKENLKIFYNNNKI